MKQTIVIVGLFFIYYHIGGLATTNILRLTRTNTLSVNSVECKCDNCGTQIPALLQFPIFSYIVCHGKCKYCGCKIPIYPLIIELIVFLGMSFISTFLKFSYIGIIASYLFYEVVRIITICIRGKRENDFAKQYFVAALSMIPFLILTLFVALIYKIV